MNSRFSEFAVEYMRLTLAGDPRSVCARAEPAPPRTRPVARPKASASVGMPAEMIRDGCIRRRIVQRSDHYSVSGGVPVFPGVRACYVSSFELDDGLTAAEPAGGG